MTAKRYSNGQIYSAYNGGPGADDMPSEYVSSADYRALEAALRELLDSTLTQIPPFEDGKAAQDAWADRRAKARNEAAFLLTPAETDVKPADPVGDALRGLPVIGVLNVDNPKDPRHKDWKL